VRRLTPPLDWSPDGRLIVFESYGDGAPSGVSTNVFTVHPDGSHLTNVTRDEGGDVNATNPPGRRMARRSCSFRFPGADLSAVQISSR
jgi:Tol biopolymer transport system component